MSGAILSCALAGWLVALVVHVLVWRLRPSTAPRVVLLAVLLAFGGILGALVYGIRWGADAEALFIILALDAFLGSAYHYLYCGLARSVSLSVLDRISGPAEPRIPMDQLVHEYETSARFDDRITVMQQSGLLTFENGGVAVTEKGRRAIAAIRFMSNLIAGGLEG